MTKCDEEVPLVARVLSVPPSRIFHVTPTPPDLSLRSADQLNERIRSLMLCSSGRLSVEQRAEYQVLVAAWATAVREEVVKVA